MVYNAMKMFMEINPQLFDDCSHDYRELQSTAEAREQSRKAKWDKLERLASSRKKADTVSAASTGPAKSSDMSSLPEDTDQITQDSRQRLHALKLQDEGATGKEPKERRHRERDGQQSVSGSQVD